MVEANVHFTTSTWKVPRKKTTFPILNSLILFTFVSGVFGDGSDAICGHLNQFNGEFIPGTSSFNRHMIGVGLPVHCTLMLYELLLD